MYAIVEVGAKQYNVEKDDIIQVDKQVVDKVRWSYWIRCFWFQKIKRWRSASLMSKGPRLKQRF